MPPRLHPYSSYRSVARTGLKLIFICLCSLLLATTLAGRGQRVLWTHVGALMQVYHESGEVPLRQGP